MFYRALVQAGNLAVVDALIEALARGGLSPLPVYVTSLKDPLSAATVERLLADAHPTSSSIPPASRSPRPARTGSAGPFAGCDCPVLQVIFAGCDAAAWRDGTQGLPPRDIAMNIALPEVDGRIIGRAVSFKGVARRDPLTEADIVTYEPQPDRIEFTAQLAANWVRLRRTPPAERRIAIVLANYPNKDGRLGNGVGLDTPSAIGVLRTLAGAGYGIEDIPADGNGLIERLASGPTNAAHRLPLRTIVETHPARLRVFLRWAAGRDATSDRRALGPAGRRSVLPRGRARLRPLRDPRLPLRQRGDVPAAGARLQHRPGIQLPRPRPAAAARLSRLLRLAARGLPGARRRSLRQARQSRVAAGQGAGAVGRLLSEAALGPLPHLYPFIVNDPGEGAQAKRRAQAVIIDHLTPPLTRAESYGPLRELERLVDEYAEAAAVDPRRLRVLSRKSSR